MQADFTTVRRGREPLKAFVATLGYSRATAVTFTANETSATLLRGLEAAFASFGGVPHEVLFDNASTVIVERDAYGPGHHRWHAGLLALAERYGFRPRVCRPYRARTKGKVERFNGYLKGSFVVPSAATLKSAGLRLDVEAANRHVGLSAARGCPSTPPRHDRCARQPCVCSKNKVPCCRCRCHRHTLTHARSALSAASTWRCRSKSLQHPLSVYEALLEVPA